PAGNLGVFSKGFNTVAMRGKDISTDPIQLIQNYCFFNWQTIESIEFSQNNRISRPFVSNLQDEQRILNSIFVAQNLLRNHWLRIQTQVFGNPLKDCREL